MKQCYWGFLLGLSGVMGVLHPAIANEMIYQPMNIRSGQEIKERLSQQDIPTGEGGFARDYAINLQAGDQVAIDLLSDDFDTIVLLLAADGSTIAENDDAADGSTNSLLFVRIDETGKYTVRVRAFGETGNGDFSLKVTRLQPIRE
ncbi:peptidase [Synechococcus moorigangaii CMS01]|nr:peptidase [Synechococcus moorigangaii CMS01]